MSSFTDAILKRVMSASAAAGAIGACAAVAVVAAAFALYAVGKELVGAPIAAAILALIFALIAGVAALVSYQGAKKGFSSKKPAEPPPPPASMVDQAIEIAKERPLIAAGVAVAAGLIALRNPMVVTTLMTMFIPPRRPPER